MGCCGSIEAEYELSIEGTLDKTLSALSIAPDVGKKVFKIFKKIDKGDIGVIKPEQFFRQHQFEYSQFGKFAFLLLDV